MNEIRGLSDDASIGLSPGDEHYRAYVGPSDRYDLIGASQFRLLATLGMRDYHKILDFGCGSLRAGRMLISYLRAGCYYGVEPNRWLIDDAVERELGKDIIGIKRPTFSANSDFKVPFTDCSFDFVLAQSILSHTGRQLAAELLAEFKRVLAPHGLIAATFSIRQSVPLPREDGWVYPKCVKFRIDDVLDLARQAGLTAIPIPYFHPSQTWFLMANDPRCLPCPEQFWLLAGGVFRVKEFSGSLSKAGGYA